MMKPKAAFSFAGEMRTRVEAIADCVNNYNQLKCHVFHDNWFPRRRLRPELFKLYRRSKLVMVFVSSTYHKKPWCKMDWDSIYPRPDENGDTLMIIKLEDFDHDEIPLPKGDGYIDGIIMSNEKIALLIEERYQLLISSCNKHV
jgi:hypothetical protein